MLRTSNDQATLWESILPEGVLALPEELAAVDRLLDDPAFVTPFRAHFDPLIGRPSIPIDTYLRMMFVKFRYRLGYETLCREVADSITWQRFCRIPLGGGVPHPTTLVKLTGRCGAPAVAGLNQTLLVKAANAKLLRTGKLRADTTVVGANVAYPTDLKLLASAVGKLVGTVRRVQAAGGATRTRMRDRRRAACRGAHHIARTLRGRTGQAKDAVLAATSRLADLAATTAAEASRVAVKAHRTLTRHPDRPHGRLRRVVGELDTTIQRTAQLIAQARSRVAGVMPDGAHRLVSLHDPDARPIRKGRLDRPVEFGYKAQLVEDTRGVIVDHQVMVGNPPDAPLLAPAVRRVTAHTGRPPRAVTADRGYGHPTVERDLHALGVRQVAIPTQGQSSPTRQALERARPFRRLVKWRTGSEGRISCLKHHYGWNRTLMDGIDGAQVWCGYGVLAHNLVKLAHLTGKTKRRAT